MFQFIAVTDVTLTKQLC